MAYNILCLETSAEKCSVAVTNEHSLTYREATDHFTHVAQITSLIKACLDDASIHISQLSAVAISDGPGSYTGLRVGASTAKGICFANDIPLIAVSTLKIIANSIELADNASSLVLSIIDARRDEVYLAGYDKGLKTIIEPEAYILRDDSFAAYAADYDQIIVGGNATDKAAKIISTPDISFHKINPDARHLAPLAKKAYLEAKFEEISSYKPFYLKPPNITVSKKHFFRKN